MCVCVREYMCDDWVIHTCYHFVGTGIIFSLSSLENASQCVVMVPDFGVSSHDGELTDQMRALCRTVRDAMVITVLC